MPENAIGILCEYLRSIESGMATIGIRPRLCQRYPFDHIALEIAAKSISLAKACIVLIEAGHQDEAYGLTRTVTECSLTLRHLTSDLDMLGQRSSAFIYYSYHYKNFWLHHVRKRFTSGPQAAAIEEEVKRWNLKGDPDTVRNWAKINTWKTALLNHPLDNKDFTQECKARYYAVQYFQPSQYVHCSQPALDGFIPDEGASFAFGPGRPTLPNIPSRIGMILITQLHQVVLYALYGMRVDRPDFVNESFNKAVSSLGSQI